MTATLCTPGQVGFLKDDDIRFQYSIGGGMMMDMGCECLQKIIKSSLSLVNLCIIILRLSSFGSAVYIRPEPN